MTGPQVARGTFATVLRRPPEDRELGKLIAAYLERLPVEVETSAGYWVLDGVQELLPRLFRSGFLLGITTGAVEAAAHIKLARARDGEAALAIGAVPVAVASGHYREAELREAGAEHVLASLRDPLPFSSEREPVAGGRA